MKVVVGATRALRARAKALGVAGGLVLVVACGSNGRDTFTDQDAIQPGGAGPGGSGGFSGQQGCTTGGTICVGNDVHACNADGTPGALVTSCDASGEFCVGGACGSGCDAAAAQPSNVGCEFWAADLDNEYSQLNDAAGAPWGVVVSNGGKQSAEVVIEVNDAAPGAPAKLTQVQSFTLAPGTLKEVALPTRELDGSTKAADDGPGTWLSSNAFHVRSTAPIVVYQFNTLKTSFSNDASLLLPQQALGSVYRVLGWPTANPITVPGLPTPAGIPDHSYVTIIGTQPGTEVRVKLGGPIVGGGPVPAANAGDVITQTLGPYDVLNLESTGIPGDMSGTVVESSAPVVVFTGGERGIAPIGAEGAPPPPDYQPDDLCCTDHLEEQLLPVTSYGKTFVVTRSPIRSTDGYAEPDLLRFMGVAAPTTVKTSLPAPFDSFTLQPGEIKDAWTTGDFVVEATEPLAVAQILVSQMFTTFTSGEGGDPSLTIFPPVDQYRRDYLFNVPTSWISNYVVIAAPVGAKVTIDGAEPAGCVVAPAGSAAGTTWEARRCKVSEGAHHMSGDAAFGIVAYGYGSAGSYAFVGGANVKKIYEPPPIK
jgi:hypothetical protein